MGWTAVAANYEIRAGCRMGVPDPDGDRPARCLQEPPHGCARDVGTKTQSYLYDFGHGWEQKIKTERLIDPVLGGARTHKMRHPPVGDLSDAVLQLFVKRK